MGEGIDTKNANMCVFVDPKTSFVKIIQNIGRVVRKQFGVDKPHSTILLPIYINKTKYEECKTAEECDSVIREEMKKGDDFTPILNVMSALKQEDEDLYDICLYYPNNYSPKEMEHNFKAQGYTIGEEQELEEIFDDDLEEVAERDDIQIDIHTDSLEEPIISYGESERVVSILQTEDKYCKIEGEERAIKPPKRIRLDVHTNMNIQVLWKIENIDLGSCLLDCEVNDNWEERLEELKEFIEREKRRPYEKKGTEKKLGKWVCHQLQNYKNNKMNDKRQKLWKDFIIKYNYFNSYQELWNKRLEQLKQFIDENKRRPSPTTEKILASWISMNICNKMKKNEMNNERKIIWEVFLEEYKQYFKSNEEKWYEYFDKVKQFMNKNKRRPKQQVKDEDIIARWLARTLHKKCNMTKKMIIDFEQFTEDYKKYLKKDEEEIWNENFDKVKQFIDKNKRRPSTDITLSNWLSTNLRNYKNKEMNDNRCKKWEVFLEEYKEFFITNEELWNETLKSLKHFIDKNKRKPSRSIILEKKLEEWLSDQMKSYKKNEMNNERKIIWEVFLEEYNEIGLSLDIIWENNLKNVKEFIDENKRRPSGSKDENKMREWLIDQIQKYKKNKMNNLCKSKWEEFLEEYKEYSQTNEEKWDKLFTNVKIFIDEHKRRPSCEKLGGWIQNQNKSYKKNEMNVERKKLWDTFLDDYKEYLIPKKSMTLKPTKEPTESTEQKRQRIKTEISELHQKYKTLTSANLSKLFEDKTKWEHYHTVSERNEESFPKESIPRNQIITELDKIKTKRPKKIVDMGCGKANISKHFNGDKRFEFTNYDHVANDVSVEECDISHMPLEDDSAEICILSLAMWGANCKEYIQEAHRVLETNGTLYIIEPTKRWTNEEPADRLRELLKGFKIIKETIEKFTMFIAIKV